MSDIIDQAFADICPPETMSKKCKLCNKEFRTSLKIKIFCTNNCKIKYNSDLQYKRMQKDERDKKKMFFKKWYQKNKIRQKMNTLRDYKRNTGKWDERGYVTRHKEKIIQLLGNKCECGKDYQVIRVMQYGLDRKDLNEYVKNLKVLCKECSYKLRKK